MIERTRRFLAQLTRDNEQIMVPSIVVTEYLRGFLDEEQEAQYEALSKGFFIPAYDARCASIGAQLSRVGPPSPRAPGTRITFQADVQIVATALGHGASRIITGNVEEFCRIAGGRIPIIDVPETWEQPDLLDGT